MGEGQNELKFEIHKTIADSIRYQGLGNSSASLWGFWILILTIIKKEKKERTKSALPPWLWVVVICGIRLCVHGRSHCWSPTSAYVSFQKAWHRGLILFSRAGVAELQERLRVLDGAAHDAEQRGADGNPAGDGQAPPDGAHRRHRLLQHPLPAADRGWHGHLRAPQLLPFPGETWWQLAVYRADCCLNGVWVNG